MLRGASGNPCAIAEMMRCPNRGRWIPDRPVKPGDDGSGIRVLETDHRPAQCALLRRDTIRMRSYICAQATEGNGEGNMRRLTIAGLIAALAVGSFIVVAA